VAKTFAETNTGSAVTVFINPGAPLANFSFLQLKMTGNNNWPPSISNPVCFSIEYPEKLVPQDWGYLDTMAQGDVDFYDTESNSRKIDLMPSMSNGFDSEIEYLKAVNSPNKISKTQDLTTDGGLKGKEVIYESGSWVVFILTTETYQGSYLVFKLSGGSSYLEDGENMAKSLKLDSSCPVQ
jgi:hypothetical protein